MKDQLHKVYLKKKAAVKAAFSFALKGELISSWKIKTLWFIIIHK